MTATRDKMIQAIEYVVKPLSVGTNLALFHLIWAMVSGSFLQSRGSVHTALKMSGRSDEETKRSGAALRAGQWEIKELIDRWREWVLHGGAWTRREHDGWYAVSCDGVVFPRLKLKGWIDKLYRGTFGRAVKAVGIGVIVEVGDCHGARTPLLRTLVRGRNADGCEKTLKQDLLKAGGQILGERGVLIHDAGANIEDMRKGKVERYVLRLDKNCVARRSVFNQDAHGNKKYGTLIRPLARERQGKKIPSTNDWCEETTFQYQDQTIKVQCWRQVVTKKDRVEDGNEPYNLWVFLTRAIQSLLCWPLILRQVARPFSTCIVTGGQLNNFHWPPSK